MRFLFFRYLLLITSLIAGSFRSYAQKEPVDSIEVSKSGRNAKTDELFYDALKAKMREDYKQATDLLEQYVAVRPEVAAAYYELSKLYYSYKNLDKSDRNIDKAEANIKKAIELDKSSKWYQEQYATILAERGADQDAAKIMGQLANAYPDDRTYPLMAAEYYGRAHMFTEAITYLDKVTAQTGVDEEIQVRKMQLYLDMNNVDKAAEAIKQLIAQEPKNGRYYKLLGDLYDNNKMQAKASEVYNKAVKDLPNDPSVQFGLAEHYLKLGDTAQYIGLMKKAIVNRDFDAETQVEMLEAYIQTMPNDSTARVQGLPIIRQIVGQHPDDADVLSFYGAFLEKNNQFDSAMIVYKRSLEIKPSNYSVWDRLMFDYMDKQYADSLVKYSEKAMRLFPNQSRASYYNGLGHLNRKEYAAAAKAVNRAIDLQPENDKRALADMYSVLADIYHSNKQNDLSDRSFEKALQLDPDNATVLNNYSYYLSERGVKLDEAEKMSKRSLALRPGEGTFLDTYGWICYKRGEYEKAKEYVQKAIEKAGASADATLYDHLGDICYKLNDKGRATEYWKKAKEKGGDDPQLDKKISEGKLYE